ncbi:MAG: hypothetical protein LBC27_06085 [Spirochaetaceae bacterium]|nr:hypothetical protein [Spirochaetaceae bacterium]
MAQLISQAFFAGFISDFVSCIWRRELKRQEYYPLFYHYAPFTLFDFFPYVEKPFSSEVKAVFALCESIIL